MGESGTGLGLVLVKELVDKLNWQIEVKSKENSGSEFIVTIPKTDFEFLDNNLMCNCLKLTILFQIFAGKS